MPNSEGRGPEAQRAVEQAERRHIESYSLLRIWERLAWEYLSFCGDRAGVWVWVWVWVWV